MKPQHRTRRILQSGLDPSQRLILVAIADHMEDTAEGEDRNSRPSVALLCEETGLGERAVQNHLKALLETGVLSRHTYSSQHPPYYLIHWARMEELGPAKTPTADFAPPRKDCAPPPAESAGGPPAKSAPEVDHLKGTIKGTMKGGEERATPQPVSPSSPPPQSQIIRGGQADIVLPAPEVPECSPLVALLMNAGMPGGHAASTANKLVLEGITDPLGDVAAPLDEWDIGSIVGSRRKGLTIKAFRDAGWKPPKEREALARGRPQALPGPTMTITETGHRIEPTGPPTRPLTRAESQIEALMNLKQQGGSDGHRARNH